MRIAVFSDNFYPELSGISDSIIETGKELARRGHSVGFFVPRYVPANFELSRLPVAEPDLGERIEIIRFGSISFPTPNQQGRLVFPGPWHWPRIRAFRPDVVHSHLFGGVGLDALWASRIFRVPMIGTNHTVISEFLHYSPVKAGWVLRAIPRYVNWYYGKCRLTTAPSEFLLKEMRAAGFRGRTEVVPNPMNVKFWSPKPEARAKIRAKFGLSGYALVYAGRFAPEKKIEVLLEASAVARKKAPDLTLALAGHGSSESALKTLAAKLNLGKNVRFLGTLSKNELLDLYRASDACVMASTSEVQSMTALQAMACGLPVVGVNAKGLAEHITPKNGFLVEPDDFEAMAEKILLLRSRPALRAKLGAGGRKTAENFSTPAVADRWEKIYESVRPKV